MYSDNYRHESQSRPSRVCTKCMTDAISAHWCWGSSIKDNHKDGDGELSQMQTRDRESLRVWHTQFQY